MLANLKHITADLAKYMRKDLRLRTSSNSQVVRSINSLEYKTDTSLHLGPKCSYNRLSIECLYLTSFAAMLVYR